MTDILTPTQRKLVNELLGYGPQRWALVPSKDAAQYIRPVMAEYLRMQTVMEERKGIVVCPSANMHFWWAAGWQGDVLTSVQFLNATPPAEKIDAVVFDKVDDNDKFIGQLDAFLAAGHAENAVLWLAEESRVELGRTLAKHRFVILNIN